MWIYNEGFINTQLLISQCYFSLEKPSKPLDPKVASVDKDSVTLAWSPPESDGGAEIFNYLIEYREEGAKKWKLFNKENIPKTTGTVKGLKKDKFYEFHVFVFPRGKLFWFKQLCFPRGKLFWFKRLCCPRG